MCLKCNSCSSGRHVVWDATVLVWEEIVLESNCWVCGLKDLSAQIGEILIYNNWLKIYSIFICVN